jgi:hypothetical protein
MALVTIQAVKNITPDAGVFRVGLGLRMTIRANEHGKVRGIRVAIAARGVVVWKLEEGVIERCTGPAGGGVAIGASAREPGRDVGRIVGGVVDRLVAAIAVGWRSREIGGGMAARLKVAPAQLAVV